MATPPSREALPPVDDAVDADLSFAANACAAGECVVEPFGARYVHARTQQDLLAGALHVEATPVIAAEELLVLVVVYEGCPESCEVAEELVRHVGIEQAFDLVVPRFQLVEGQQVGVRTSLRVPVGEAYTTGGWDVQLTGTLTFEGS